MTDEQYENLKQTQDLERIKIFHSERAWVHDASNIARIYKELGYGDCDLWCSGCVAEMLTDMFNRITEYELKQHATT